MGCQLLLHRHPYDTDRSNAQVFCDTSDASRCADRGARPNSTVRRSKISHMSYIGWDGREQAAFQAFDGDKELVLKASVIR